MKLKSCHLAVVLSVILVFSTGCISFKSNAAGVVPSAKTMSSTQYEVLGEAEGTSSSFTLFWWIPATKTATVKEAVDDAVRSKGGDNLIEAVFTKERKVYIIGTVDIIYAKGKVIRYILNR